MAKLQLKKGSLVECEAEYYINFAILERGRRYIVTVVAPTEVRLAELPDFIFPPDIFRIISQDDEAERRRKATIDALSSYRAEWLVQMDAGDMDKAEKVMARIDFFLEKLSALNKAEQNANTKLEANKTKKAPNKESRGRGKTCK